MTEISIEKRGGIEDWNKIVFNIPTTISSSFVKLSFPKVNKLIVENHLGESFELDIPLEYMATSIIPGKFFKDNLGDKLDKSIIIHFCAI